MTPLLRDPPCSKEMKIYHTRYNEVGLFVQGFLGPPKPNSQGRGPGNVVDYYSLVLLNNVQLAFFAI